MNYLKSGLTLSAAISVGIGAGLLARVGFGATTEVGADVLWFDQALTGAQGGVLPNTAMPPSCEACTAVAELVSQEPVAEAQRIADGLEARSLPLLLISENSIEEIDLEPATPGASRTFLK